MLTNTINTLDKILSSAKKEFLEKGFKDASLRTIANNAGVTTGAIYGYFKDKDSIFDALVRDSINELYKLIDLLESNAGHNLNYKSEKDFIEINKAIHLKYIQFIYDNFDECKLVLLCSNGSKLENFKETLLNHMITLNEPYIKYFNEKSRFEIDNYTIHLLIEFFFKSVTDLIKYNIPYDEAVQKTHIVLTFFFAGLSEILK